MHIDKLIGRRTTAFVKQHGVEPNIIIAGYDYHSRISEAARTGNEPLNKHGYPPTVTSYKGFRLVEMSIYHPERENGMVVSYDISLDKKIPAIKQGFFNLVGRFFTSQ